MIDESCGAYDLLMQEAEEKGLSREAKATIRGVIRLAIYHDNQESERYNRARSRAQRRNDDQARG